MGMKRLGLFAAGIALTIGIVSIFGLKETISILLTTRLDILMVCIILQLIVLALLVLRIKILAYGKGYVSLTYATRLTLSGVFVNMITPFAKLGGEPLKMYMLGKNIGSYNSSAAIAIESVAELLSSFVVLLAVTLLLFGSIPAQFLSLFLLVLVCLAVGVGIMIKILSTPHWLHGIGNWVVKKVQRFLVVDSKDHFKMFSTAFHTMWKAKKIVIGAFSVSLLAKIVEIIRFWFVFLALGIVLPFNSAVVVWTILLVVMFIPWLPGSLGLVEFSGISMLILVGVPQSSAASGIVLDRFISFWLPLVLGLFALSAAKRRGELPDLSKWKEKRIE